LVKAILEYKFREIMWRDLLDELELYREGASSKGGKVSLLSLDNSTELAFPHTKPTDPITTLSQWGMAFAKFQSIMVTLHGDACWNDLLVFHQEVMSIATEHSFVRAHMFILEVSARVQAAWSAYLFAQQGTLANMVVSGAMQKPRWETFLERAKSKVLMAKLPLAPEPNSETVTPKRVKVKKKGGKQTCHEWTKSKTCKFGATCKFMHVGDP
jgi:hypothetical protein